MFKYLLYVVTDMFSRSNVACLFSKHFIFQHNALRAICPATVNIVMGIVSHASANTDVRRTAVRCFVLMVQLLNRCSPDQVSICVYNEATESSPMDGYCNFALSSHCFILLRFLLSCQPAQRACHY